MLSEQHTPTSIPMLWSDEERRTLAKFVESCDDAKRKDWVKCSAKVKTKTPRQCFDFYFLQQKNSCVREPQRHAWTQEECEKIRAFNSKETSWKKFQEEQLPYLTLSQIKNMSHFLKR